VQLIGLNEAETSFAVFDGVTYKCYRVYSNESGFEGVALHMEGPDDPVANWVFDTLQGAPDNWKHLDEPEDITDIRWIGKRDGRNADGVLIQTSKRRIVFGSVEKERQMTAEEQAEHAAAVDALAKRLTAQGGKVTKTSKKKSVVAEPAFFWDTNDTTINEYEEELVPPPGEGGQFPEEWAFRMMHAVTFVYRARNKAGLGI
jgi:hypothetical protein